MNEITDSLNGKVEALGKKFETGMAALMAAVRPARNTLSDGGDYTAAAAATADASEVVETSKQAQQRRLMSLQVDAALHCMPSLSTTYG